MKNQKEILSDLSTDSIAAQDKITWFGKDGAFRGLLSAISFMLSELWNDIYQIKRKIQETTATGTDLEILAERKGITRSGATKSAAILLINGIAGTVIPKDTVIVSSVSGEKYLTVNTITLGGQNPSIERPINSNSIGDIVIAESANTGSKTAVGIKELTEFETAIDGVTSVTNLVISTGGQDKQSDEELRELLKEKYDLLNQGTEAFYEALAKSSESTVLLAKAGLNNTGGISIYLVKSNLSLYSDDELETLSDLIYSRQRAFNSIICTNASRLSIEVNCYLFIKAGVSADTVYSNVASVIADYVAANMDFAGVIKYQGLLNAILDAEGVTGMDLSKFYLNNQQNDLKCTENQVPVFTYLKADYTGGSISETITQSYLVI